ncbi:hypothetical protein ACFW9X_25050, partial [Streptomyces sp. NPDC059466]
MNVDDTTGAAVLDQLRRRSADPRRRILFTGATIVTMDPELGVITGGELLVEGSTIIAVGHDLGADGAVGGGGGPPAGPPPPRGAPPPPPAAAPPPRP